MESCILSQRVVLMYSIFSHPQPDGGSISLALRHWMKGNQQW